MFPVKISKINKCKRPVDQRIVDALKQSIKILGLQAPIQVIEGKRGRYILVDGLHRLEAYKALGYSEIIAVIKPSDEVITVSRLAKILGKPEKWIRGIIFGKDVRLSQHEARKIHARSGIV